jgi:hypothetical protein
MINLPLRISRQTIELKLDAVDKFMYGKILKAAPVSEFHKTLNTLQK